MNCILNAIHRLEGLDKHKNNKIFDDSPVISMVAVVLCCSKLIDIIKDKTLSNIPQSLSQVLITGVYRTGSEYIAHNINRHPLIDVSMYRINAPRFIWGRYDPISLPKNYRRAVDDIAARVKKRYNMEINTAEIIQALDETTVVDDPTLYDVVMCAIYLTHEKRYWAEKNQLLWRQIPYFIEKMRNGKAILIIRDPRSVLASFKAYTYAPPPAYLGAVFNCFDAMKFGLQYKTQLPTDRFWLITYEDFARNPEQETKRIYDFLGLEDFDPTSNDGTWVDAYGKPWHSNSSFQENRPGIEFDLERAISRWKNNLNDAELALCETVCGEYMPAYGYEPVAKSASWLEIIRMFIDNESILEHFRRWLLNHEGIQEFPTDPVNPANWRTE